MDWGKGRYWEERLRRAFVIGGLALALAAQLAVAQLVVARPATAQRAAAEPTPIKIGYLGRAEKKATISLPFMGQPRMSTISTSKPESINNTWIFRDIWIRA